MSKMMMMMKVMMMMMILGRRKHEFVLELFVFVLFYLFCSP